MEITAEGDPLAIAEKRTFAHADRKIVRGSTPTEEDVSLVERAYNESDMRVYEIPCPHCAEWFELLWEMIQWPEGEPDKATGFCPRCGGEIEERWKPRLVEDGRWRAQRPEIVGHRGYRLNTLVSLLPNAAWGKLAAEFLKAKRGGPAELQVFTNLTLGKTWRTSINRLSADVLAGRVEPIGLERIPEEIVLLTAGADVQDDRVETCVVGWPLAGAPCVLAHVIIDGNTLEDQTWRDLDAFLMTRWRHPFGWEIKIDGTAINSGGHEGRTQKVYDFCRRAAASADLRHSRRRRGAADLGQGATHQVGQDGQAVHPRPRSGENRRAGIAVGRAVRRRGQSKPARAQSERRAAAANWFDQVTGEVRRVRYVRNRPVIEFTPKRRGQQVEALDALCYAWGVRQSPAVKAIDLRARAARRPTEPPPPGAAPPTPPRPRQSSTANWAARFNE